MFEKLMDEIKTQLNHPFVRERRIALGKLAELLQDPNHRKDAIILLKDRAVNEPAQILRDFAQSILDNYLLGIHDDLADEEAVHFIKVSCPKCHHANYFNKREICGKYSTILRGNGSKGMSTLNNLLLKCQNCDQDFEVQVDCEGYV
jgi:hypothetical protein